MELFEAIAGRHSYRGSFLDRPLPREDLRKIVQAGIQAPSGYNGQSTTFVIVDDPGLILRLAEVTGKKTLAGAKAVIVCVMDPRTGSGRDFAFGVEDYSAAVENMLLAITALGYATVWIDGALRSQGRAQKIGALLGVPPEREIRVILPLGVPAEPGEQKSRKPFQERAWFNRYG